MLDIGGEFVISLATHHGMADGALADIGDAEREAAEELERAIRLYDEGPRSREQHWFAGKPLAGIDLAVIRLRSGALDAAAAALEPTFLLPAGQRITQVITRLMLVHTELAAPIFRGSAQARGLGEQIEEFARETIVTGPQSLPGRPRLMAPPGWRLVLRASPAGAIRAEDPTPAEHLGNGVSIPK